jgi:hypothetical protein
MFSEWAADPSGGARGKVEKREAGKFFIFFVTSASLNHD